MATASSDPKNTRQYHSSIKHREHLATQERDRRGRRDERLRRKQANKGAK